MKAALISTAARCWNSAEAAESNKGVSYTGAVCMASSYANGAPTDQSCTWVCLYAFCPGCLQDIHQPTF